MTNEELQKLKDLAIAAGGDDWDFDTAETPIRIAGGEVVGGDALPYGDVYTMRDYEQIDEDGEPVSEPLTICSEIGAQFGRFIARASPAAVLELIAHIEELDTPFCVKCGGTEVCATQPAQDRCCEHDSDCAVHNAPAYPVGSCDCTLSGKPAKEQVAAVRAVLSDEQIKDVAIDYAKHVAADIYDVTQYDCAEDFFNCVRACILAAAAPAPDHETIVRQSGELICTACGTTAPQPQPSGNSCDSDWFWNLVIAYTKGVGSEGKALVSQVDAWKEAACAEIETKRQVLSSAYRSAAARATDAEAKLAEVRGASAYLAADAKDYVDRIDAVLAKNSELEAKLAAIRLTDAQIIQRAGEIFGFKPHEMGELVKSQYLDFARWAAGEE